MVELTDEAHSQAHEVARLVHELGTLLHGRDPAVQSGALADLLAMWLAGHVIFDDTGATARLREWLLSEHLRLVRDLVKPNGDRIIAQHARVFRGE